MTGAAKGSHRGQIQDPVAPTGPCPHGILTRMRGVATLRGAACLIVAGFIAVSCRERQVQAVDPAVAESVILGASELKVGDLAPDFSLPGSDGKTHELASYKGRQAVVLAWFAKAFTGA